jgi:hypothetical protein
MKKDPPPDHPPFVPHPAPYDAAELNPRLPWHVAEPRDDETMRWECADGGWVSIAPGFGATAGMMLVADSAGRCESVASYDDAVALAKSWRDGLRS